MLPTVCALDVRKYVLLPQQCIRFICRPATQTKLHCAAPFEANTSCSSSRNSHADGLDDKTCGNRLSEGSQPATREVTQEVKLSLSVPLRVRVDHKPYRARNQNNKGGFVGVGGNR